MWLFEKKMALNTGSLGEMEDANTIFNEMNKRYGWQQRSKNGDWSEISGCDIFDELNISNTWDVKIISGGQTGVDQGALCAAFALGVPFDGAFPKCNLVYGSIPNFVRKGLVVMTNKDDARLEGLEVSLEENKYYIEHKNGKIILEENQLQKIWSKMQPILQIRTEKNASDGDGTILAFNKDSELSGGTQYTLEMAEKHGKPVLRVNFSQNPNPVDAVQWMKDNGLKAINIGGPNERKSPGIQWQTFEYTAKIVIQCCLNMKAEIEFNPTVSK